MPKRKIVLILPNIRSLYNVGSFFRTADAFGVEKIYLVGFTGTPNSLHGHKIAKTSLGAEKLIPWDHRRTAVPLIKELKKDGWQIAALEQSTDSKMLSRAKFKNKVALVVGNEVKGLSKSILKSSDLIVEISMLGFKESLNVSVAGGIALYVIRNK